MELMKIETLNIELMEERQKAASKRATLVISTKDSVVIEVGPTGCFKIHLTSNNSQL